MANEFAPDEFDEIDESAGRVGAHRARKLPGRGWITLAACIAAVAVIIGAGYFGLHLLRTGNEIDWSDVVDNFNESDDVADSTSAGATDGASSESVAPSSQSPSASASPQADKTTAVRILNATQTTGLAATLQTTLTSAGWTSVTTGNNATLQSVSTVYYPSASLKATADAVASRLKIDSVARDASIGESIVVVVGADYN